MAWHLIDPGTRQGMEEDRHEELVAQIEAGADEAVRVLVTEPRNTLCLSNGISRISQLQERYCREFPRLREEADFWEALWLRTDRVRSQWNRIEKAALRARAANLDRLQALLDEQRAALYHWSRRHICEHAPRVPLAAHFELGIQQRRSDCRVLHERLEGLYESIKRMGGLPEVREAPFQQGQLRPNLRRRVECEYVQRPARSVPFQAHERIRRI